MTRYFIITIAVFLSACSSFTANWYHLAPDGSSPESGMSISVLNRSDRTCSVTRVYLNPMGKGDERDLVWTPVSPISLAPGELFWVATSNFVAKSRESFRPLAICTVPIALVIEATGCGLTKKSTRYEVSFRPRLPASMPDEWRSACDASKPFAAASAPP